MKATRLEAKEATREEQEAAQERADDATLASDVETFVVRLVRAPGQGTFIIQPYPENSPFNVIGNKVYELPRKFEDDYRFALPTPEQEAKFEEALVSNPPKQKSFTKAETPPAVVSETTMTASPPEEREESVFNVEKEKDPFDI